MQVWETSRLEAVKGDIGGGNGIEEGLGDGGLVFVHRLWSRDRYEKVSDNWRLVSAH